MYGQRRMPRSHLVVLSCVLGANVLLVGPGYAAQATLVRDLYGPPQAQGSYPRDFVPLGERALFVATTPEQGDEPWVTDGTPAGTHLLEDLEPGPDDIEFGGIRCAVAFGSGALMLSPSGTPAADGGRAFALWRTDGSTDGTEKLTPIAGQGPCAMAALDDRVVFTVARRAPDLSWVLELWVSDATVAGTRRLASFPTAYEHFTHLQRAGDQVFFAPRTDDGVELWRTDGSAAGTAMVADLVPGPQSSFPHLLGALGDLVVFEAGDGAGKGSLWRSDGTAPGTYTLAESPPYGYYAAVRWNGRLLLGGVQHVLVTNGRRDGTSQRAVGVAVRALAAVGDTMFILSEGRDTPSVRVWRWDDPDGEPALITEVAGAYGGRFAVLPNVLLFSVSALDGSRELWRSDGSADGTGAILSGQSIYALGTLAASGPRAYFAADGPGAGFELWSSDGTAAGTALLANIAADDVYTDSSEPRDLAVVNGRVIFTAIGGAGKGRELWGSDGTAEGTTQLRDFDQRSNAGIAVSHAVEHDGVLFLGVTPNRVDVASGLWRTDGTAAGTQLAVPVAYGRVTQVVGTGDALYFATDPGSAAVCRTLGSEVDTTCAPFVGTIREMRAFGERVIFSGGPSGDEEPWISDGTAAGTELIRDLRPGGASAPDQFTTLGADAFFVAQPDAAGSALWRTDGTAQGTEIVRRIDGIIQKLTAVGDRLFFVAGPHFAIGALWTSDGTVAGTQPVPGASPTVTFAPGQTLARLGRSVLVAGYDDAHGQELWISDGTGAGTEMIRDLLPGPKGSTPYGFRELGDRVAFVACAATGCEPWITDGTSAGTVQLADIAPGIASSNPSGMVAAGGALYLSASDHVRGYELWRIALEAGCPGDCGGDGAVSIADAITAVAIALGARPTGDCAAADADADGSVTISELVAAVRAALEGCR